MERLLSLNREDVQARLTRLEPEFSVSESIADELALTVFDQGEACLAMGKRLAMWQSGLTEPGKPIGVLFFAGPPGTGKTSMAEAAAKYFFDDARSERLIRLDMSDYQQEHTAQKLTGSPPGYVGHSEEPAIPHRIVNDKKAPSIVLLDEIEKAHPAVLRSFLQAFDKGELNARDGDNGFEIIDLSRTLFIMTSNIASSEVVHIEKSGSKKIGFARQETNMRDEEIQKVIKDAMKQKFPPEFLDRVDQFVRFMPLESEETRRAILMKFVGEQNSAFKDRWGKDAPYLALTREAQIVLLANKDDKGGRGIKRELNQRVTSQLPDVMMGMDFKRRPFVADIEDGKTVWYTDVRDPEKEELKQLEAGREKKLPTDPWFNLPEDNLEDDGDEEKKVEEEETPSQIGDFGDLPPEDLDVRENGGDLREPKNVTFFIPKDGGDWATVDLSIVIHEKGRKDKMQLLENIPLLEGKM